MKKYIGLLSIAALATLFSGCSKESPFNNEADGPMGYLAPEALSVSVSNEEKLVRADVNLPDVSNFTITITKVGETKPALTSLLSRVPEVIALPVGDYTVVASYGNNSAAAFEAPYFRGESSQFTIEADKITSDIEPIVCKLSNIKVSVHFDDSLSKVMSPDSKVTVNVGESGTLDFTPEDNERSGYFAYVENSNTLAATFNGEVEGIPTVVTKAYDNVAPGNHYRILFTLVDPGAPEPGSVSSTVKVDATVETVDLNTEVDTPDADILPDDMSPVEGGDEDPNHGNDPDDPNKDSELTVSVNAPYSLADGAVNDVTGFNPKTEDNPSGTDILELHVTSSAGLNKFVVRIESQQLNKDELEGFGLKQDLDLINPGECKEALVNLGFPVEDQVKNQKSVTASITKFIPLLAMLGPGVHKFVVTVGDANVESLVKTLTIEVK